MGRPIAALAGLVALFAVGLAVSAFAAGSDAPLKSQTYEDPVGDAPNGVPDLAGLVVANWADGTLEFDVALPKQPVLAQYTSVGIFVDGDRNGATGDPGGFDYILSAGGGGAASPPSFELLRWNGTTWIVADRLSGQFTAQTAAVMWVPAATLKVTAGFDFLARGAYGYGGTNLRDDAPAGGTFDYELGVPASTTTTAATTAVTTTVVKPKPKPKPKHKPAKHKKKH